MTFKESNISEPILKVLTNKNYETPTLLYKDKRYLLLSTERNYWELSRQGY